MGLLAAYNRYYSSHSGFTEIELSNYASAPFNAGSAEQSCRLPGQSVRKVGRRRWQCLYTHSEILVAHIIHPGNLKSCPN